MADVIISRRTTSSGGTESVATLNMASLTSIDLAPMWLYDTNTNFTVPENGVYRIFAVGAGGNGYSCYDYGYGAGGGAGGVGVLTTTLTKGSSYPITVSRNVSSFGSLITATGGTDAWMNQKAPYGGSYNAPIRGNGGTASGTNVVIYNGGNGQALSLQSNDNDNSMNGGSVGIRLFGYTSNGAHCWDSWSSMSGYKSGDGIFGGDAHYVSEAFNKGVLNYTSYRFSIVSGGSGCGRSSMRADTTNAIFVAGGAGYGGGGASTKSNSFTGVVGNSGAAGCVVIQWLDKGGAG